MVEIDDASYKEYLALKEKQKQQQLVDDESKKGPAIAAFSLAMTSVITFIIAFFYLGAALFITPITSIISLAYVKKAKGVKTQPHQTFVAISTPVSIVCLIISLIFFGVLILVMIANIIFTFIGLGVGILVIIIRISPYLIQAISQLVEATSSLLVF